MTRPFLILATLAALSGCDLSMKHQRKLVTQSSSTLWAGGPPIRPSPAGTVAFEATADAAPPAPTPALFARGREQYRIFCAPCHGERGRGDGVVVSRGFPAPQPLAAQRAESRDQIFAAISKGAGLMYGFADRVSADDRWAIVLYVRALQSLPDQGGAL